MSPALGRVVVIGIGNPWRRDDGAGWAVLDAIGTRLAGRAQVVRTEGEPTGVIEAWTDANLAIVVDAVHTGSPVGTVHRMELGGEQPIPVRPAASSHGTGLDDAVLLGRALGRMPGGLTLIGIEAGDVGHGHGVGPAVARSVGPAADQVVAAVDAAG